MRPLPLPKTKTKTKRACAFTGPSLVLLELLACFHFPSTIVAARKKKAGSSWDSTSVRALDLPEAQCSMPRVPAAEMTRARFETDFRGQGPVVIAGLVQAEAWLAPANWQKAELLRRYGDRTVRVRDGSTADRVKQNGGRGGSKEISLRSFGRGPAYPAPPTAAELNLATASMASAWISDPVNQCCACRQYVSNTFDRNPPKARANLQKLREVRWEPSRRSAMPHDRAHSYNAMRAG
jgi:hypothetical protein